MNKLEKIFINACHTGKIESVKFLLRTGVDPSSAGNDAIRLASNNGHTEIVKLLLNDKQVDPSADYNYAIRYVSRHDHTEVVKLLEQHGCKL